jgi:hypothetical protein
MDEGVVVGRVVGPGSGVPQFSSVHEPDAVSAPPGSAGGGVVAAVAAFRAWLAGVDSGVLSDRERVDLVGELERVKGAASAAQARATDAVVCSRRVVAPQDASRSVGSMVALARRESPTLGDRFVGLARALVHEMPFTMAALSAGQCGERVAVAVVAATAALTVADRAEVDSRVGPLLGRLGVRQAGAAAARVAAELDAASVVARLEAAVRSRRVTVRPAPDGMAYLSVLGPLKDVVGAYAAVQARSRAVVSGQCVEEGPDGRGVGAVAADTALQLLSGRAGGQAQPVEVHLVMTDRALLGTGDPGRSVMEPARIPGHGSVPAPVARAWLRQGVEDPIDAGGPPGRGERAAAAGAASNGAGVTGGAAATGGDGGAARVWVRRLYTSADGRDLVGMDSRRRLFGGLLRRMLVLRDDVCTTAWCEAPIAHADHTTPAREGGATSYEEGSGRCARCNHAKEAPGWRARVILNGVRRVVQVTTPLGHQYASQPPPLLGWGSVTSPTSTPAPTPELAPRPSTGTRREPRPPQRRRRPLRRPRTTGRTPVPRRTRLTSHLERRLCRYLT